uniref:UBX domain-containing protein 7 n=2 Tax=Ascaris TaxID=6251 RepID=F1L464_ASCSU
MENDDESILEKFKSFTGCTNDAEAEQLMDACNGDVAMAVDLYFQQRPAGSPDDPQCSSSPSVNRHNTRSSRNAANVAGPSKQRRIATFNGSVRSSTEKEKRRKHEDDDDDCMVVDDEVRAPIAPIRGAIVEQTFRQQYETRSSRHGISIFDSFRDFREESEDHLAAFQNGNSQGSTTHGGRRSLQVLFRPPLELIFRGEWESARAEAQRLGVWLMVNIQNVREFACQALNRDVWSNAAVKELLRSNFLFWQIYHDSADGNRIGNYYRITSYPAIFVVDPRTGELLTQFRAQDAVSFCDQVTTFLDTFPDFAARDRHLIGATAPAPSAEPTPSKSVAQHISGQEENGSGKSSSSNGHRKRTFLASQDDEDDRDEETKKSRKGEDMPDIDAVVSKVSKATTVDKDEWRNYLGEADGKGRKVSIMLRFPDGDRQTIEVEDTTPLRALFMLIAGRGFSPCEHILVLSYPKREYSFEDGDRSLRELQLNKRELIHVESK